MILNVDVVNKIATFQKRGGNIVCGNSDYIIKFTFDSEWSEFPTKTARFISNGQFTDVDFTGDYCTVPILYDTPEVEVGVYAGKLKTTTSAVIKCNRSILCDLVSPSEENDRTYANEAKEAADRAEVAAEEAADKVVASTNEASTQATKAAIRAETAANAAEDAAGRAEVSSGGISAQVDNRLKVLEEWMADANYKQITASLSVNPSTAEVGQQIKNAKLTWSVSKPTTSITLDGVTVDGTSYTDENTYTGNKTWTIKATETDRSAVATATAKLTFKHRVYWGVGTTQTGFDSDFVKALASSQLATSKAITLNVSPSTQHVYYAVPKDLCGTEPTFIIDNGFAGGFEYKEEIVVTNAYGADIVYYVYRSDQLLVGSTRVDVS